MKTPNEVPEVYIRLFILKVITTTTKSMLKSICGDLTRNGDVKRCGSQRRIMAANAFVLEKIVISLVEGTDQICTQFILFGLPY